MKKIVASVIIAFILSFGFLFIFLQIFQGGGQKYPLEDQQDFYLQKWDNSKKVFILGTSHTISLNTTLIEEILLSEEKNYDVYNLAIGSNEPKDRIKSLDWIVKAKPDIVIYGIAERDFRSHVKIKDDDTNIIPILPDPQRNIHSIIWNLAFNEIVMLENPKFVTLAVLYNFVSGNNFNQKNDNVVKEDFTPYPNIPFYDVAIADSEIINRDELIYDIEKNVKNSFEEINLPYQNPDAIALKEIIKTLQKNEIKIIIFTTPHHELYNEVTPKRVEESFQKIIDYIIDESGVSVYPLHNKYSELEIWHDPTHIAVNKKGKIYSEDIAKIIILEV